LNEREFARRARIDTERLRFLVDCGWISPLTTDGKVAFQEADVARAALIADLGEELGVNDDGIDVVLNLVDQLYSLRLAFSSMLEALQAQPAPVKRHIVKDAQKLDTLQRRAPSGTQKTS
jgi:chaperone modulatory protein CbpM